MEDKRQNIGSPLQGDVDYNRQNISSPLQGRMDYKGQNISSPLQGGMDYKRQNITSPLQGGMDCKMQNKMFYYFLHCLQAVNTYNSSWGFSLIVLLIFQHLKKRGSVVECLTGDRGAAGFEPRRRGCVVSMSKNINPSLALVQPRKTHHFIIERLLIGCKESNQTKRLKMVDLFIAH